LLFELREPPREPLDPLREPPREPLDPPDLPRELLDPLREPPREPLDPPDLPRELLDPLREPPREPLDPLREPLEPPRDLLFDLRPRDGDDGTLPPSARASERPIAIACLRFVTFLPERPERNVPSFISCIERFTFDCALLPYFRREPLREPVLRAAMGGPPSNTRAAECATRVHIDRCGKQRVGTRVRRPIRTREAPCGRRFVSKNLPWGCARVDRTVRHFAPKSAPRRRSQP
jgi:hypothetical protein